MILKRARGAYQIDSSAKRRRVEVSEDQDDGDSMPVDEEVTQSEANSQPAPRQRRPSLPHIPPIPRLFKENGELS